MRQIRFQIHVGTALAISLGLGFLLGLAGCGGRELHVIAPIPRLTAGLGPRPAAEKGGMEKAFGFLGRLFGRNRHQEAVALPPTRRVTRAKNPGVWLSRSVYDGQGKTTRLKAIEILFCPLKQANYHECRVGIGWSGSALALGREYPAGREVVPSTGSEPPAPVAAPAEQAPPQAAPTPVEAPVAPPGAVPAVPAPVTPAVQTAPAAPADAVATPAPAAEQAPPAEPRKKKRRKKSQ